LAIRGGMVLTPAGFQEGLALGIGGGRIAALGDVGAVGVEVDATGLYVLPGFVDVHVHGAGASSDPLAMARFLPRTGVTAFLPTLAASSAAETLEFAASVAHVPAEAGAAEVLGSHLEGPYLSPRHCGAQPAEHLRAPDRTEVERMLAAAAGTLRRMTIAPELAGAREVVSRLTEAGVQVSLGHSACSYETAMEAAGWGASSVTHAYNAMAPFRHRSPGLAGAALAGEKLVAELIADGVHVHPAAALALVRARGPNGVAVVSDGLPPLGLPPGEYDWAGRPVVSDGVAAWLAPVSGTATVAAASVAALSGPAKSVGQAPPGGRPVSSILPRDERAQDNGRRLAGSVTSLAQALRNLASWGVPLADAARMLALPGAQLAGAGNRKGAICEGFDADLVLLDHGLRLVATYCRGVLAAGRVPLL